MNWALLITQIIAFAVFFFFLLPMVLFLAHLFFDLYNKFYLRMVGQGNRWHQNFFIFPVMLLNWRKRGYIKKNLSNGTIKNHIAIVLANNYFPENIMGFGLDNAVDLIKYLKKENKNYRVYNKVTSAQLKRIIKDKRVSSIFLFGHGERHGIKVGRNEAVYYCEFPNHPKKHLIAQFHCNHLGGKSLSEYGKKPIYSSVSNDVQNQIKINKQLKEIIKRRLV